MLTEAVKGVYTIAVTPFLPNGAIDFDSVDRMVDFYIEKGATGLTILGMMGEAGKLSAEESMSVVKRVIARTSVPVVVGVSASGYAAMESLSKSSMDAGAAGVMVAPTTNLRSDDQIIGYFHGVANVLGTTPFVLQDFPLATSVVIPTKVIQQIIDDCPTCVMLKHEDWPGLDKITALRAKSDAGNRRISILCGNGGMYLLEEMLRGADGAMTGFAYPEMMAQVVNAITAGDETHARDIFDTYMPMVRYEAQPGLGLAIRKYSLAKRGAIAHPTLRKPGGALNATASGEVDVLAKRQTVRLADMGF
ncbi:MAG: dihydrodipicolinate synthase family protein [Pseudoprimorskyibacter sp.]|nr:dihydrodipicolinate synthase family protein [Pseudoprimorskyibacter sp.]